MKYLSLLKFEISLCDELPKLPKAHLEPYDSFDSDQGRHIFKNESGLSELPKGDRPEIPVNEDLKSCCLCGGVLFHRSVAGGYFCIQCQVLPDDAIDTLVRATGLDLSDRPDQGDRARQINCQAFEHNGVMMSTRSNHCREWQGNYCNGCSLFKIQ